MPRGLSKMSVCRRLPCAVVNQAGSVAAAPAFSFLRGTRPLPVRAPFPACGVWLGLSDAESPRNFKALAPQARPLTTEHLVDSGHAEVVFCGPSGEGHSSASEVLTHLL